jgi:hypothetical protein
MRQHLTQNTRAALKTTTDEAILTINITADIELVGSS